MPYREVGMVKNATKDLLVGLEEEGGKIIIRAFATSDQFNLTITLKEKDRILIDEIAAISPEVIFVKELASDGIDFNELILEIKGNKKDVLITYSTISTDQNKELPQAAKPALQPSDISNNEELFLTGQHLEQYRHATYSPVPYYQEALFRDPTDLRSNNALGAWYLRRG